MIQLEIQQCQRDEIEVLSEVLESTAALSITLTDKQDDPILEPELGTTPLWPYVVVQVLYNDQVEAEGALAILSARFPHLRYSIERLPEQDWQRVSIQDLQPQQFGERLWICPSWVEPPDPKAVNLILDPGLAFGTGSHPTTTLCLSWLEQANLAHQTMIDYGCGSGILALAALKLGASYAYAVDIDEQALIATQNNAFMNHIPSSKLSIALPDVLTTPVDLLVANILLSPLIALQHRFRELLTKEGTLVISGILVDQMNELIKVYDTHFYLVSTFVKEDWASLVFSCRM